MPRHKLNEGLPLPVSVRLDDGLAENVTGVVDFPPTSAALTV
jgi:hypothetical protein